jgi:hypothetical protein
VIWETRLVERFPCNAAVFSGCSAPTSKDPEHPRNALNLSPEPSPTEPVLVVDDGNRRASPGRPLGRRSFLWR